MKKLYLGQNSFTWLFRTLIVILYAQLAQSFALAAPEMCIEINAEVSTDSNLSPDMRQQGERFVTLNPGDSLQTEVPFYTFGQLPCYGYREKMCTAIYRGCFSADRLKYDGQNAFQISIKWPYDGSPIQSGRGQMAVQLVKTDGRAGRSLCTLNWSQGSSPLQTCNTTVYLSLREIDPELWQRTQNLAAAIQNIQFLEGNLNTLRAEVARYEQIVAEFTGLSVSEILARLDSLRGDPVFQEIANAIAQTRGEYQALKQKSAEALAQASSTLSTVNDQTKQLVEGMKVAGVKLPDLPVLEFKYPASNGPDPFDDITVNPYAAIANTLYAEINALCPQSPCIEKGPAVIARVLEWQDHAAQLRESLQARSQLSPKEAIAFETAVTEINQFLQQTGCGGSGCLKADLWLTDSSVPQATRANISQNIEPVAPNDAAALRESLADWRGTLTPEQKLVLQMIDALGIFYKNSLAVSEDLKQAAQVKLRSLTQSVASTAKAVARVGVVFTPAGDIIDFCELTTGKEFCNPNGNSLSSIERTFSGIGIFLGSGKLWRSMSEGFEATSEVGKAVKAAARVEEAAEQVVKYGPLRKGPLHEIAEGVGTVADTFRSGSYVAKVLQDELLLCRVYEPTKGWPGRYWSKLKPNGRLQAQLDSALIPSWGNTAKAWVEIKVPKGTKIYEGVVAPQFICSAPSQIPIGELYGGGSQIYIPLVDPVWRTINGGGSF